MQLGICCSPLQYPLAVRLTARFARNLGIATVIVADESARLMESWEQASASDAVLLMLDGRSAPGPVKRGDWQSLLDHTGLPPVATLKMEHCWYPKLLERRTFFAAGGRELEAERWVERWLVGITSPETRTETQGILRAGSSGNGIGPADWWAKAVDSPGTPALTPRDIDSVQTFACEAGAHFQQVVWIGCEGVPPDALISEIILRCASDSGRLLIVLVHADPGLVLPPECASESRHSFVILYGHPKDSATVSVQGGGNPIEAWISACRPSGFPAELLDLMLGHERRHEWESLVTPLTADGRWFRPHGAMTPSREACQCHLEGLQRLFERWRRQPALCRDLRGEAAWAIQRDGLASGELCLDLAMFLLAEKRISEAVVWLRMLAARAPADEFAAQARDELRWLVDEFSSLHRPQPIVPGEQVCFPFPGFDEQRAMDDHRILLEELREDAAEDRRRTDSASSSRWPERQLRFDLC